MAVRADLPSRTLREATSVPRETVAELQAEVADLERKNRRLRRIIRRRTAALRTAQADQAVDVKADWTAGYTLNDGAHLQAFVGPGGIISCEGGFDNPAIRNDGLNSNGSVDFGPAQINDAAWEARFEQLTNLDWDEWIIDPFMNGWMAAHVEREHATGLNAWVGYQKGCGR